MVELTIDGHRVEMPEGSMVMHAVEKLSQYVPHFCYHKKLSIAANCRMCLVEVEKAPKPLPACATPVTQGMIVHTNSPKAKAAQEGVMEFLLINHPLDCPICDQGGECQLQDLAVGYGQSTSRYQEEKRTVEVKEAGALISMQEMTRCIHCTRCVRFGQEVAGVMELGMIHRGEHSEITTFLGQGVHSELSGNMIDLCPVGALTSKPFRYQARTWELSRRKGISVHDSLGSNLTIQVKNGVVKRVLPLENEEINECWLSDRDRFSYEGLNSEDRLTEPMIKRNGQWHVTSWEDAFAYAGTVLNTEHACAVVHAMTGLEELYALKQLVKNNLRVNLQASNSRLDVQREGVPGLAISVDSINALNNVFIVGGMLRQEHPLLAVRLRAATKRGMTVQVLNVLNDDLLMPVQHRCTVKPSDMLSYLAKIARIIANIKQITLPDMIEAMSELSIDEIAYAHQNKIFEGIAQRLCEIQAQSGKSSIILGQIALNHTQALELAIIAQFIADCTGATVSHLVQEANAVGVYALNLNKNIDNKIDNKINCLYNVEPNLDINGQIPFQYAEEVVAFTAYRSAVEAFATVMLPITPMTESGGTLINIEGRIQFMNPVAKPLGHSKPGWKVLKVLADTMNIDRLSYDSLEQAKQYALNAVAQHYTIIDGFIKINNQIVLNESESIKKSIKEGLKHQKQHNQGALNNYDANHVLERIVTIPMYSGDVIVRRASSLQTTSHADTPKVYCHSETLKGLNIQAGQCLEVKAVIEKTHQINDIGCILKVEIDDSVPQGCTHIVTSRLETVALNGATQVSLKVIHG